jgi:hypothetical protein
MTSRVPSLTQCNACQDVAINPHFVVTGAEGATMWGSSTTLVKGVSSDLAPDVVN